MSAPDAAFPRPMSAAQDDTALMRRALALAREGAFTTTPNPRVGCVLARDGEVLGEGFHERAGGPHAEVRAIAHAHARGHELRGATAYVTLEPCNHHGRTGPCSEALIAAGIGRVVAAMRDPNRQAQHGTERLRGAGVAVEVGLLEAEARFLNRGFVARMERGTPWVRMKLAASLDGRTALANGASQWITGAAARADGHRLRAEACAVVTGSGTILADDPALTVRDVATPRQPLRIVLDSRGRTPPRARIFEGGGALVITAAARHPDWPSSVEVITAPTVDGRLDLRAAFAELGRRELNELHVEAGPGLNGALLAAGLVDEVVLYLAPCFLGDPARGIAELASGLTRLADRIDVDVRSVERVGEDWRVFGMVRKKER